MTPALFISRSRLEYLLLNSSAKSLTNERSAKSNLMTLTFALSYWLLIFWRGRMSLFQIPHRDDHLGVFVRQHTRGFVADAAARTRHDDNSPALVRNIRCIPFVVFSFVFLLHI